MRHWIVTALLGAAAAAALCGVGASPARAEEGGSGHYGVGATASFIDVLPGVPGTFGIASFFMYYDGRAGKNVTLNNGGQAVLGMEATAYVDSLVGLWETKVKLLGGDYGVGIGVPILKLEVDGTVTGPNGLTYAKHDSATGLGDIILYPLMIVWKDKDIKYGCQLGVYAPTGAYEKGRLANLGKNYWTFEPAVAVSWLSSTIGTEATAFAAFDINTRNTATDYLSGTSFHFDGTLAQHLPVGHGAVLGVGANVFYYKQVKGDDYPGKKLLGPMEGRVDGVGPELSLIAKAGEVNVAAELKWLPDSHVEHRTKGDTYWLKVAVGF